MEMRPEALRPHLTAGLLFFAAEPAGRCPPRAARPAAGRGEVKRVTTLPANVSTWQRARLATLASDGDGLAMRVELARDRMPIVRGLVQVAADTRAPTAAASRIAAEQKVRAPCAPPA